MPRIYNKNYKKEKDKEFIFMSSFYQRRRSITVFESQLYRIMWRDIWLLYRFDKLQFNVSSHLNLDKNLLLKEYSPSVWQRLKVFYGNYRQDFLFQLMNPNSKSCHMFQKLLFAKAHSARLRVKNRHQGNLEVVQVCCWLGSYGRCIGVSTLWSSISTDVVGEQIYYRLVLGFFGWNQIRC